MIPKTTVIASVPARQSILIISDLHLTSKFDQKKFDFLKKLISKFDQVIINGDLWCAYTNTFDQFIDSLWRRLFPLLKSKKTVYLNGNHDPANLTDQRVFLFCDQYKKKHTLEDPPYTFHIQHGHQLVNKTYPVDPSYFQRFRFFHLQWFIYLAENLALKIMGLNSIKLLSNKDNNILRQKAKKLPANEYLVCGHTHLPEFDQKNKFINTGFIDMGHAYYLAIYGDSFELITDRY